MEAQGPTPPPTAARDTAVTCPQCGGETPLPSGRAIVRCDFCDAALFVDRSQVVSHYRLPPLLDRDQAAAALRRWMSGNETVKDLDRKSRLESLTPTSFPMWLFRIREGGGEKVFVEPAAPTPIPQLADLQVPAGKLETYRGAGEGVETVEAAIPLETARGWLEQRGVTTPPVETALVRVPLWRCAYSYRDRSWEALVEASTGTVLAAVYPEKAESPYLLVALLGVVLFGLEGLLINGLAAKLLAYLLTAVPLLLIAWWVTRKV